ncbi:MAG: lysoplasmalogenase [Saprospiraceae bacterium]|nr:lysoplasmalogenase [Saprospiraceae bacterium]
MDSIKYKSFTIFYSIIFFLNLLFFTWLTEYRVVSKPMIMASLIGFYISSAKKQSNAFLLAMIFALFGDIFLMFNGEEFFLIGLSCFLVMQLLYTITFLKDRVNDILLIIYRSLPILFISIAVIAYLWNGLGEMRIPVSVYTAAISLMVISALIRRSNMYWYFPVVIGVILFMISDALIAVSKFGPSFNGIEYGVMATYMLAQYLIVRGMIEKSVT